MTDSDCISIREQLSQYPGSKLGFVVYRLTYNDNARWDRFMEYLNTRIRLGLENTGDGDLFEHIDWDVQEDPILEEAEEPEVRRYGFLALSPSNTKVLLCCGQVRRHSCLHYRQALQEVLGREQSFSTWPAGYGMHHGVTVHSRPES